LITAGTPGSHGQTPPPRGGEVLDLLRRRRAGYRPGSLSDGHRLGLVVEGGGMRAVISSAALEALDSLGFRDCFDEVCGTSAGAINGAYFLSGRIASGTSIYYENLVGRRFINLFRWPNIMDLDYLFDEWVGRGKPLGPELVCLSPARLSVAATDIETGQTVYFDSRTTPAESLIAVLRASAATPLLTTHRERLVGREYNDGMLRAGIPLERAVELGCSHILCLLTRPRGYRKHREWSQTLLEWAQLRHYSRPYREAYRNRAAHYNRILDRIWSPDPTGPAILAIAPARAELALANGETDPAMLRRAVAEAHARIERVLGNEPRQATEANET